MCTRLPSVSTQRSPADEHVQKRAVRYSCYTSASTQWNSVSMAQHMTAQHPAHLIPLFSAVPTTECCTERRLSTSMTSSTRSCLARVRMYLGFLSHALYSKFSRTVKSSCTMSSCTVIQNLFAAVVAVLKCLKSMLQRETAEIHSSSDRKLRKQMQATLIADSSHLLLHGPTVLAKHDAFVSQTKSVWCIM